MMLGMNAAKTKSRRGRPAIIEAEKSVRLTVVADASVLNQVDTIITDMRDPAIAGLRLQRTDIIRAALERGVAVMRTEIDAKRAR